MNIRIPAGLKERLERHAAMNKRSTTAEIVDRLHRSFHDLKLPPKLVVRMEVLREGPAVEIPVLDFFRSMSQTLREQVAEQLAKDRAARRAERDEVSAGPTLEPAKDQGTDDGKVVENAVEEVLLARAKNRQRRLAQQVEDSVLDPKSGEDRSNRSGDSSDE